MKKITLVFALIFSLCLFAGCQKSNNSDDISEWDVISEENNTEMNTDLNIEDINDGEDSNWWIISALYKNWWKVTCEMDARDETFWDMFVTLYIDGNNSLINATMTDGKMLYVLNKDWKTYTWWDMYWEWFGFVVNTEKTVADQIYDYEKDGEDEKMDCKSGIEGANFYIPSDIGFSDLSNLRK